MFTRIVLLEIVNIYLLNDKIQQSNNLLQFLLEKRQAEISSSDSEDFCNRKKLFLSQVLTLLAMNFSLLGKLKSAFENAQESYNCLKDPSANHSNSLFALLRLGSCKNANGQCRARLQDLQKAVNGPEELRKTCPEMSTTM